MVRVRLGVALSSFGSSLVVLLFAACVRESNNGDLLQEPCTRDSDCVQGLLCEVATGVCQPSLSPQGGAGGSSGAAGGAASGGANNSGGHTGDGVGGSGSGGSTGSGGSAAGGTTASGSGGSASGGGASGGGASGGAAAGSSSASGGAPVTTADTVDDFEDGDGRILESSGRKGAWHIFHQGGGNQLPSGDFLPEQSGANGSKYAAHTSGGGFEFAGMGCDLNNADHKPESSQSQPFNASAFKGIAFFIKGKAKLRVEFPTRNFVPPERGGSCSNDCWRVYGYRPSAGLSNDWQEIRVQFSQLVREDDSTKPPFDAAQLMSISFKHEGSDAFDFWIDDVRFIKE